MDNDAFRKSLLSGQTPRPPTDASTPKPSALGSRKSNFAGATPRRGTTNTNNGVDFARQIRERNASSFVPSSVQNKKRKPAAVPKGSKLGAGYTDRAQALRESGKDDDRARRIKALEEQAKLGQIEPELFAKLRDEIVGGEVESTHLVKGLDWKLLARVRKGEDVMGGEERREEERDQEDGDEGAEVHSGDEEDELEKLEQRQVKAVEREHVDKVGVRSKVAPAPVAGVKRSRSDIMKDFREQRAAAAAAAKTGPVFDSSKWKKIGNGGGRSKEMTRTEIDRKGREVLVVIDRDGKEKRMIKKPGQTTLPALDPKKPVMGADFKVPELPRPASIAEDDEEERDVFSDVEEYDPTGGISDAESSDEEGDDQQINPEAKEDRSSTATSDVPPPSQPAVKRSYFNTKPEERKEDALDDKAALKEILAKAAKLRPLGADGEDETASQNTGADETPDDRAKRLAREKRHKEMLENQNRDFEDMDMGFGGGRFDDEEDGEDIKLSKWQGLEGGDGDGEEEGGMSRKGDGKKKRKAKKRKGDANNVDDVMRVIEGRKKKV